MHNSVHSYDSSNFLTVQQYKAWKNTGRMCCACTFSVTDCRKGGLRTALDALCGKKPETFRSTMWAGLETWLLTRWWCYALSLRNQRGKVSVRPQWCIWMSYIHHPSNKATAERLEKHLNCYTACRYGGKVWEYWMKLWKILSKTLRKRRKKKPGNIKAKNDNMKWNCYPTFKEINLLLQNLQQKRRNDPPVPKRFLALGHICSGCIDYSMITLLTPDFLLICFFRHTVATAELNC